MHFFTRILAQRHLEKRLTIKRESGISLDFTIYKPAANYIVSCITVGLMVGEMVTPKVSYQSKERNEEKRHQLHGVDILCGRL
ncbi:hypothetical protein [Crinalium epipsammum]|uniref:hypothetical protein n=1 Tax=Crinalium epipsammum TaxID=241425 RepID=UPI0012FC5EA6|nr:hypothetical protein [Crinalium epipsammum]